MTGSDRILVIKLGALGDFIQALGPMRAIRRHHPHAHITLLTTKPFVTLGQTCGYFDDVVVDRRPRFGDIRGWLKLRRILRGGRYARVYDLQNNDRTSFYLRLWNKAARPEWVGAAKGASHRNDSPARTAGTAFAGHVQTLALAGVAHVTPDDLSWAPGRRDVFGLAAPYVLLVPGSAPAHPEKRWPVAHYTALARRLAAQGITPVLIGTDAERTVTQRIHEDCAGCVDLTGCTNLFDIATLARGARAAVGNDTGPVHVIAPTGCRTVVLFSRHSNPARHAPLGPDVRTLQQDELAMLPPEKVWECLDLQAMSGA